MTPETAQKAKQYLRLMSYHSVQDLKPYKGRALSLNFPSYHKFEIGTNHFEVTLRELKGKKIRLLFHAQTSQFYEF